MGALRSAASRRGTAMIKGLLPTAGVVAPQGGRFGSVLRPAHRSEAGFRGLPAVASAAHPVRGVGQRDGTETVVARQLHRAGHRCMRGQIAGAPMPRPALQRTEARDALRFRERIDAAEANHLCKAGQAGDAMRADAVAIGLGDKLRGQCRSLPESKLQQDPFDVIPQLLKSDTNHAPLEPTASIADTGPSQEAYEDVRLRRWRACACPSCRIPLRFIACAHHFIGIYASLCFSPFARLRGARPSRSGRHLRAPTS